MCRGSCRAGPRFLLCCGCVGACPTELPCNYIHTHTHKHTIPSSCRAQRRHHEQWQRQRRAHQPAAQDQHRHLLLARRLRPLPHQRRGTQGGLGAGVAGRRACGCVAWRGQGRASCLRASSCGQPCKWGAGVHPPAHTCTPLNTCHAPTSATPPRPVRPTPATPGGERPGHRRGGLQRGAGRLLLHQA